MPRQCGWCVHPRREELERRILSGESVRAVAVDSGHSESAAQRHVRNHLGREVVQSIRGSAGLHVSDFSERMAELANETAAVRAHAKRNGDARLLLSAVQAERDTLNMLMARLGIDGQEVLDELTTAAQLARALNQVLWNHVHGRELAAALATDLRERGEDELGERLLRIAERSGQTGAAEISRVAAAPASSVPPLTYREDLPT